MTPKDTDRRSEILDAAAELFAHKGVASTTVREIGESVGIYAGAIYHYFPSKDAIVRELITGYLETLNAEYAAKAPRRLAPRARLRAVVEVSLRTADEKPHATQVYQDQLRNVRDLPEYRRAKALADEVQRIWLETIEDGKAAGVFRADISSKVFHRFLRDAIWLSIKWRHSGDPYTTEELVQDCIAIFLDGFAVRRARRTRPPAPPR
ncbi:TetR/AcrR family transcriptional regulator [Spirillospora sp. NPDC029432]|uniref:TetR/AcrR family transcriptional regulator n=1 Tax=Spirillospora sp. NPDC029432 TaxID=3154599 RepID=UPI003451A197